MKLELDTNMVIYGLQLLVKKKETIISENENEIRRLSDRLENENNLNIFLLRLVAGSVEVRSWFENHLIKGEFDGCRLSDQEIENMKEYFSQL